MTLIFMIAIALPMPMQREKGSSQVTLALGMMELLDKVDQLFTAGMESFKRGTKVTYIRDTLLSLVVVRAFQTALGRTQEYDPILVCNILGEKIATFVLILTIISWFQIFLLP